MKNKNIAIIVPVYNENIKAVETVNLIIKFVPNFYKIIIVDDGSSDNSFEILNKHFLNKKNIHVLKHMINLGKGAAMKTGLEMADEYNSDSYIFIDADGQHDPKYLPTFIEKLNKSPIVFGYRELNKKSPWIRRNGNKFAGWLIGVLFNIKRKDLLCGFLGFNKDVYEKIKWKSCRYGIETEIATKIGKNNINFSEIKIDTIYIDKYKGVTIFDAFKILFKIPVWYFAN